MQNLFCNLTEGAATEPPRIGEVPGGKTCTKCGEWKLLDEYHHSSAGKFQRKSQCKACAKKYNETKNPLDRTMLTVRLTDGSIVIIPGKLVRTLPDGTQGRTCTLCERVLVFDDFYHSGQKLKSWCKDCTVTRIHTYRATPKWKKWKSLYSRRYEEQHKDALAKQRKAHYQANKQAKAEYGKRRWLLLRDNAEHQKKRHAQRTAYKNKHREKCREHWKLSSHRRRARKLEVGGSFSKAEWYALCAKYGNKCLRCGADTPLEADHVTPLSRGGTNTIGNIQPLCGPCNRRKNTKTVDYRPTV